MHVGNSIQDSIAFIGYDDPNSPGGIRAVGTLFLLHYDDHGYLVTNRHVIESIGDAPCLIRINRQGECDSTIFEGDNCGWHFHPDATVDLAIRSMNGINPPAGHLMPVQPLIQNLILTQEMLKQFNIGIGDFCYVVGMFRFLTGNERNLPILYTGHISLLSSDKVPLFDKSKQTTEMVDGWLIQSQGLPGSSGSPVFVRPTLFWKGLKASGGREAVVQLPQDQLYLLGVLQGGWFLPPDEMLRREIGATRTDTVPLGFGVIVPAYRILEMLETEAMKNERLILPKVFLDK